MFLSILTDELGCDVAEALPIIKSWGLTHVDFRGRVFSKQFSALAPEELAQLRRLLEANGLKAGCLESSLAKVHLPNAERQRAEAEKLEGIIRAADALDCRLVRSFFYWQPPAKLQGELAVRPDELQKVLDMFGPLAERARRAGLVLAFEDCGTTPDEVIAVLDALAVPTWGMAWDPQIHWKSPQRAKDEDAWIVRLAQRSKLVHVKARGAVAGLPDELLPWDEILQVCDNAGLQGPVSVETHNPDKSVPNAEMSRRTVEAIKKAWPTAAPGGVEEAVKPSKAVTRPWSDQPVGFVVVGLGMGHNRSKGIAKTPGTRLIGVCDIREERAKRTGEELGVPYTTDAREWLDKKEVEAVFVLTETGNHARVGLQALEAGKHVMTTKPMDATVEACDALICLAEKKGLLLAVDFDRRNSAYVNTLKAAVEKKRFGRLLSGNVSLKLLRTMDYFRSNGGWRGTRKLDGGGVFSNQSIHHIDEVVFTVGVPAKVRCNIWTQTHEIEAEDLGMALWLYEDGTALTFNATSSFPQKTWYFQYELTGTQGAYFTVEGGPFLKQRLTKWFQDGAWSENAPEVVESPWLNSMDNFAAAIRTGAALTCSGRDGRRSRAVLDAMYKSAYEKDGGWVGVRADL